MQTELSKVALVFVNLFFCSIFVVISFAIFGDQFWLPFFIGIILFGIAMYVLFIVGFVMLTDYFDRLGEFDRHEDEGEE